MRHRKRSERLGKTSSHREAMLANMTKSLVMKESIETTLPKAKVLRRYADRAITLAKENTLSSPRFKERNGGYTRIIKTANRIGDDAQMCVIQYLEA